ncbi:hypothetical protein NDU88_005117 [Pleurodeles waltl]|uniref:Uncharacterized protein n=1 Tax=Pleurodeles waltl TaxID=8319 RepID=A0AAV7UHZ6_PLEWA|nr:hypothetical protein NDU88_005117 [Pleurodeles waltl]
MLNPWYLKTDSRLEEKSLEEEHLRDTHSGEIAKKVGGVREVECGRGGVDPTFPEGDEDANFPERGYAPNVGVINKPVPECLQSRRGFPTVTHATLHHLMFLRIVVDPSSPKEDKAAGGDLAYQVAYHNAGSGSSSPIA